MKLTLLGTGTPAPSLKRASSGYLIDVGEDVIAIDHGPGAARRLLEAGRRATEVSHLFLSHLHYDHFMEYPHLCLQRWDMGADQVPELKVYGPEPLHRITGQLFGEGGVFAADIAARIGHQLSIDIFQARGGRAPRPRPRPEVTEIRPGDVIDGNGWRIRVGEGSHVQPYLNCYAYRLESDEGSICYSGDSGGVCPGIVELARGCDVLIHMNHYFSGTEPSPAYRAGCGNHEDTARVAAEAGVKTLVLTHILEQIDRPGTRERIIQEIGRHYDGVVIWGEDLMEVPVQGQSIERID